MFTLDFNEKNQEVVVLEDLEIQEFVHLFNLMYGRKHLNGNFLENC